MDVSNFSDNTGLEYQDLLSNLENGRKRIQEQHETFGTEITNANYILGPTGSGKTTLLKILTDNLDSLEASDEFGERIIKDDSDLIGMETLSKTFLPNCNINNDNETIFWDCPGFDDNRGDEIDIIAMYFLNYILSLSLHVKLLFTTEFSTLKVGNRLGIEPLLNHVTQIIPNISTWKDSFALVVTKVPSINENTGSELKDSEALARIEGFLRRYVQEQEKRLSNATLSGVLRINIAQRVLFVKELLTSGNICIVRKPAKLGKLINDNAFVQTRENILQVCNEKLRFRSISQKDFKISLKDSSKVRILDVHLKEIDTRARGYLRVFVEHIQELFKKQGIFNPIVKKKNYYSRVAKHVRIIENHLASWVGTGTSAHAITSHENVPANLFSSLLKQLLQSLFNAAECEILDQFDELERHLDFFEYAVGKLGSVKRPHKIWHEPLQEYANQMKRYAMFYKFCEDVVQRIRGKFSTATTNVLQLVYVNTTISKDNALNILDANKIITVPVEVSEFWGNEVEDIQHQYLVDLVKQTIFTQFIWHTIQIGGGVVANVAIRRFNDLVNMISQQGGFSSANMRYP